MRTILIVALVVLWVIFIASVMMMSPKGWLWLGIGWASASGWWDFGSKKSMESKLKNIAIITSILFVVISLVLPFVN